MSREKLGQRKRKSRGFHQHVVFIGYHQRMWEAAVSYEEHIKAKHRDLHRDPMPNTEEYKEKRRNYYAHNKKRINERDRTYYHARKEKINACKDNDTVRESVENSKMYDAAKKEERIRDIMAGSRSLFI